MSQYPQPAPRKSNTGKIVLIVLGLVLLVCSGLGLATIAGIGGAAKVVEQEGSDRASDITIDKCDTDVLGLVNVNYTVVNSASTPRSYFPTFNIVTNDGTIVGSTADFTPDVPAGGTFKGRAIATLDDSSKRLKFKCVRTGA